MYAMYPEWGPAKHREEGGRDGAREHTGAVQTALDLRDKGAQRPDDN